MVYFLMNKEGDKWERLLSSCLDDYGVVCVTLKSVELSCESIICSFRVNLRRWTSIRTCMCAAHPA